MTPGLPQGPSKLNPQAASNEDSSAVFERAAEVFALLGTPLRLRIVSLLCDHEMNVRELRSALGGAQPRISQSLAMLHRCGVLTRQRRGENVFYSVDPSHSLLVCDAMRSILAPRDSH